MKTKTLQRHYRTEAIIVVAAARLAVRFFPPAKIFAWADRPPRKPRRFVADEPQWIAWAIDAVAAQPWMNALCLPRALAAHAMLRRRGIASRLCLGVARRNGSLAAHAWVELGEQTIIGGAEAQAFNRLAAFGATPVQPAA